MLESRLTKTEQELTLVVCRDDDVVRVYTSDRRSMVKLDGLCEKYPDVYRCTWVDAQLLGDGLPMGKRYVFPRRFLRFGVPASVAQRAAARASIARINSMAQS